MALQQIIDVFHRPVFAAEAMQSERSQKASPGVLKRIFVIVVAAQF